MIFIIRLFFIGFLWSVNPDTIAEVNAVNPFEDKEPEYILAPDFKLNSISFVRDSLSDNFNSFIDTSLVLSNLKGSVVLINFWATWCGPCIAEMPEFNQLYDKYHSENFEILGISISDNRDVLMRFLKKYPVHYNTLYSSQDVMSEVINNYGGFYSIPISFLVNRDGYVVRGYPGAILGEYWSSQLHSDLLKFLALPKAIISK